MKKLVLLFWIVLLSCGGGGGGGGEDGGATGPTDPAAVAQFTGSPLSGSVPLTVRSHLHLQEQLILISGILIMTEQ